MHGPVRPYDAEFLVEVRALVAAARACVDHRLAVFRVHADDELLERADRAPGCQPEEAIELFVPVELVGEDVPVEGARAACIEGRLQGELRLLEARYVGDGPQHRDRRAVGRVLRLPARGDPRELSTGTLDAELAKMRLAPGDARLHRVAYAVAIFRVHEIEVPVAGAREVAGPEPVDAISLRGPRHLVG
ncbi:MAG TPA: hypothetical protein VN903_37740, partial [Polyangia bacterium]|nr:hypothetical protein [Polyangia bacterium]